MTVLSKTINELYPDVIAMGGLTKALQSSLREIGSALTVQDVEGKINFVVYARVASGTRSSQVCIGAAERVFLFDFWARGVNLANGQTPHLLEVARAIDTWVASDCNTTDLARAFGFVVVKPDAAIYERGEEVEARWQDYIKHIGFPELVAFVEAAARRPELRQLFPYTSLNMFCFSRCTGYPFTDDTPHVCPTKHGQYDVVSPSGVVIGSGNADEAADLVVANLPSACGPAVAGTADDL
jgi:hypothetical protein